MGAEILHSGFDGMKFTIQADITPELREELASAKEHAKKTHGDCVLEFGPISLNVTNKGARGFTAHTGDHGAIWLFQDPEDRIANTPGVTVDFRAFGLATGGLGGAERHFRECLDAFAIKYVETQLRVTRADFAVDFLAPWFEPDREALVVPPGTKVTEYTGVDETATVSSGSRVVGLRAGAVANRQIAIYDKRAEVIQRNKPGWLVIWNTALKSAGKPPLNLSNPNKSQVWRFEMRLGSKQLRNRFELRNWRDVHDSIGDAFTDSLRRIRYCIPTADSNRARWPVHGLWQQFEDVIGNNLLENCAGVLPKVVIQANRAAKMRELDAQLSGLFITRAAISGIAGDEFDEFLERHFDTLAQLIKDHPVAVEERIAKAGAKYRFG